MRPTDKATADSRSVQSFAIIKNTGHGTLELEMEYTSKTSLCTVPPPPFPTDRPFSDFFWGNGGAVVHRLSRTDNPVFKLSVQLTDKVRRIGHSKLKPFYFQIKTYYLSDTNYQTVNPSHTNDPSLVWKRPFLLQWMLLLGLEMGRVRVSLLLFLKDYF